MTKHGYEVRRVNMKHRGGTKEYHLIMIRRDDGVGITIARWNGVGKWGQVQVEKGSHGKIEGFFLDKKKDKTGNGYGIEDDFAIRVNDGVELKNALGEYWPRLDKLVIEYILGTSDGTLPPGDPDDSNEPVSDQASATVEKPVVTADKHADWGSW